MSATTNRTIGIPNTCTLYVRERRGQTSRYKAFHTRYSQYGMMMTSPDVYIPAGPSCADAEEDNFEPSQQSQHDDQKFSVDENNYAASAGEAKDTPCTVPLDDVSIIESEIDLGASLEESSSKQGVDLEVGISGGDENDTQSRNECEPRITPIPTVTPFPTEHALDPPTSSPATDVEQVMSASANEGNSYTVTWRAVARGEKWCGTTVPRFFWLMVLLCLIAVLCASVGYIVYSLQLLQ